MILRKIDKSKYKEYMEYAEECTDYDGDSMIAKLIDERPNYTEWLTEIGIAVNV